MAFNGNNEHPGAPREISVNVRIAQVTEQSVSEKTKRRKENMFLCNDPVMADQE